MRLKIHFFYLIALLMFVNFSCGDSKNYNVPSVPVNLQLSLTTDLAALGVGQSVLIVPDPSEFGWIEYLNGTRIYTSQKVFGRGLILYRLNMEEFKLFDRTCSNSDHEFCGINLTSSMINAKCPCCESTYEIVYNGAPVTGPAPDVLREYTATVSGSYLILTN
jgi:hypothetical protein